MDTEARNIIDIIQQPYGAYVCWLYWVFCTYSNNKKSESKSNIWSDNVTDVVFVEIGAVIQDKYGVDR